MKIVHVVGARPNFMKVAPIAAEMSRRPGLFDQLLVHTGQHYDENMSKVFFDDLALPEPDEFLAVGSGTHAEQTARVMMAFEPVVLREKPDWVVVVGDVNSTLACALVCAKLGVRVAHVEAGLRSRDRSMPEETNRIVTDQIADLLLTPSRDADANLAQEGIPQERIRFVGNVMIDSLVKMLPRAEERPILQELGLDAQQYLLVTLHRPSNVDEPETLREIADALTALSQSHTVVFPVHPRTRARLAAVDLESTSALHLVEPLGYLDFLALMKSARLVLTDSGGTQEETTYLNVPCLTARPNTERPITIEQGTNQLVGSRCEAIVAAVDAVLAGPAPTNQAIEYWDGNAAGRIVDALIDASQPAEAR